MHEHKTGKYKNSFTHRYNVTELVYFEEHSRIVDAIAREKQLKAGSRQKKLDLINSMNPCLPAYFVRVNSRQAEWKDLTEELS